MTETLQFHRAAGGRWYSQLDCHNTLTCPFRYNYALKQLFDAINPDMLPQLGLEQLQR